MLAVLRSSRLAFQPALRLRALLPGSPSWLYLTRETECVIEGYWRSGNTFAADTFLRAQRRPTKVMFHTHAAATILNAVRYGTPVLLLARHPLDAITGRVLMASRLPLGCAVREYVHFYRALQPLFDRVVCGTFEDVTTDLGGLIGRVNARFGTVFRLPVAGNEGVIAATADLPRFAALTPEQMRAIRESVRERVKGDAQFPAALDIYRSFSEARDRQTPHPTDAPVSRVAHLV